jgi:hypothetical protein
MGCEVDLPDMLLNDGTELHKGHVGRGGAWGFHTRGAGIDTDDADGERLATPRVSDIIRSGQDSRDNCVSVHRSPALYRITQTNVNLKTDDCK